MTKNIQQTGKLSRGRPPVAILAGGLGTRLSEETAQRPKPLVEIGGRPVIWHVMKHYDAYGMNGFAVIALGYKKEAVIRYFLDLHATGRNLTVGPATGPFLFTTKYLDVDWTVHLVDTGADTSTGGRIKRLRPYLGNGTFMLTWCDGISNVNLAELLAFHRAHGKLATMTVVRAPSRFGFVEMAADEAFDASRKNQSTVMAGSMAHSSCWSHQYSTTSPATKQCGSASRSKSLPPKASLSPSNIIPSGNAWIRCGEECCSRTFGARAKPPWKTWE